MTLYKQYDKDQPVTPIDGLRDGDPVSCIDFARWVIATHDGLMLAMEWEEEKAE